MLEVAGGVCDEELAFAGAVDVDGVGDEGAGAVEAGEDGLVACDADADRSAAFLFRA